VDDYFGGSTPRSAVPAGWAPPPPAALPPAPALPYGQAPPYAVPAGWSAPQSWNGQQSWVPPASGGRSPATTALIAVAAVFGTLVVVGLLVAIAIPVFLNQRGKDVAARTTVAIPPTAAGLPLRTDAAGERLAQPLRDLDIPGTHLAGAYGGAARPEAVVGITKHYMSPADQRGYLRGSVAAARRASDNESAEFGDIAPGLLGGTVRCSSASTMTVCFFVDAGAYGSVVVFGTEERAMELVPQLRAAVEHRA
jgi:hypothetical protein